MNLPNFTLEQTTLLLVCFATILFLVKAFSWPINNFLNAINPFCYLRQIKNIQKQQEELMTDHWQYRDDIKDLRKEIEKLKALNKPMKAPKKL